MLHKYPTAKNVTLKKKTLKNVHLRLLRLFSKTKQQLFFLNVQTLPVLRGRILYREREREGLTVLPKSD